MYVSDGERVLSVEALAVELCVALSVPFPSGHTSLFMAEIAHTLFMFGKVHILEFMKTSIFLIMEFL